MQAVREGSEPEHRTGGILKFGGNSKGKPQFRAGRMMLNQLRVAVCALLMAVLAGCALAGGGRPPTLAELELPDRYSLTPAAGGDAEAVAERDTTRWWTLFDDPLLANLAERAETPSARADIARTYLGLRLHQARIVNARAWLDTQREIRDVARYRVEARLVTERDVLQIDAASARIAADIPLMEAAVAADAARIAVLAGEPPGALRDKLAAPGAIPTGPDAVPIGVPSDLLERRADLRRAADRLGASNGLGARSGTALASFRHAVLAAQEDVENALATFNGARARAHDLADALQKAEAVARLAYQQYHDGLADYDTLADAEEALLGARDAFAEARVARARALIDLCVALGEGTAPGEAGAD